MLDEHRFGHDGTRAAGTGESGNCRQQMEANGERGRPGRAQPILARWRNPRNAHEFATRMDRRGQTPPPPPGDLSTRKLKGKAASPKRKRPYLTRRFILD
jgi:hypothetical protein